MIDKELRAYRTYQRFLRILLTMCGCWYMPTKSGKCMNFWVVGVLLVIIPYATVSLNLCYITRHNLAIMMKCVGIAISSFSAILKIGTFLHNRASLINYHRTLNDLFEEELLRNEKIRTIIFSSLPTVYTLAYTYSAILIAMMLAFSMPAYLSIIVGLCRSQSTTNYSLPITRGHGYFWTVPRNYLYHFHLLFETGGLSINSITACGIDSIFGFYVYQFASTMHAMTFRLTNPLPNEKFSDVLRSCMAKHQRLLPCRDMLEHIYGPIVFWHIVTNAVLLCALIYEAMSFSDFNIFNIGVSVTYATIKLLQTFTYAWYGTLLTNASEDFRKGIYFGEWPNSDLDHHVRTNIILMMMQKPMTINAFFSLVDMNMFTNSLETSLHRLINIYKYVHTFRILN
ncbi:odorant receptor 49a-like isoform X2 [Temnothorax americanus]|uniref:odorant receptor 49a-like isoform X2 n=1 Tax=Temnothorax americanus TaxID=1964332 RepID=UPI004068A067